MDWIGQSLPRVEDERLLKGDGRFVADIRQAGTLEAAFLRSPHAHAEITRIDVSAALELPGVVAVFTEKDIAGRTAPICVAGEVHTPEKLLKELKPLDRVHPTPLFPSKKVTYVGQPVALVIAESLPQALDALEVINIEYRPLASVIDPIAALEAGAPLVEPDWKTNLALSIGIRKGDPDQVFSNAPVVVEDTFVTHRYLASPLETRGIQAAWDAVTEQLTVWASTQTAHVLQGLLAVSLQMPVQKIRVIACDVGGGFGQKGVQSVEDMLVAFAARALKAAVRWIEQRGENLIAAPHARDQIHRIAIAASEDGRILAVRDEAVMNCGAYNFLGMVVPYNSLSHLLGPYDVPNAAILVKGVLTNTCFTTPYRGAGRPEAVFAMERIIERLARRLNLEPADLRARNLVPKEAMPYDTGLLYRDGFPQVYDSGDFPELLRRARALVELDAVRAQQQQQQPADRKLLGVGFAMYVEGTGMGPFEGATVEVLPSGRVQIATGACSSGQGHHTTYAQIAADVLHVPIEKIDVIGGDTAAIPFGIGTIASRSTVTAGNAVHAASLKIKDRILHIASELLEAAVSDLELAGGCVRLKGIPGRSVELSKISRDATAAVLRRGASGDGRLAETTYFRPPTVTYASAAHAAVVAVDIETGAIGVERYVVVHDCGRVVNPVIADAQIAGGVMQGIGGVLYEEMVYDERGQPLSGSFMDYAMPVATQAPPLVLDHIESRSTRNPLGVKGLGEGGAIAPPAALANAVEDALRPYGVVVGRGPLTAARIRTLLSSGAG